MANFGAIELFELFKSVIFESVTESNRIEGIAEKMEVLEVSQALIDSENATVISDSYSDFYEGEWEDVEYEDEEEAEAAAEKAKQAEEIDIYADLLAQFRDTRAEKIAAQAEAEKGKLRHLIGIKKVRGESEETLITPEEISDAVSKTSSESSTHPCFKDIDISDSQLKLQNLYTMYPVPDDPGLVPAFWSIQDRQPAYAEDGVKKFFDLTKASGINPIQSLEDMLLSDRINLQYYGINSRVMRPLCEALINNPVVQKINFTGNWLSEDACYHLNDLLLKNSVVNNLILSGCKIGAKGAAKLQDGILENTTLRKLDLSDCNIGNDGFEYISHAVRNNESIEVLSLKNNHLDESSSEHLQKLLGGSKTLKRLDLSWNSLYMPVTWRSMIKGLELNQILTDLDLSWNALGKECVPYLRQLLSRSPPMKILRLNGNRFNDDDVLGMERGISRNEVLEELYLGNNPITGEGVMTLVKIIAPDKGPGPEIPLRLLDLTNIWAKKEILEKLEIIQQEKPWFDIKLGGILGNFKLKGPDVKAILLSRANYEAMKPRKKRQRKNFGHFVLTLPDNPISKGKFTEMIKKFRLKLSQTLINEMIIAFAITSTTVNAELLKSVYMMHYPDTKPPSEKAGKKKKGKGKGLKAEKEIKTDEEQKM